MAVFCTVSEDLREALKKFRYRKEKTLGAILIKIYKDKQLIEFEEEWKETTIEEIAEEIPPQQPRYVVISYPLKHDDGRVSYPLLSVYISPEGCNPELQMIYAGSKTYFVRETGIPESMDLRSLEDFTDENVQNFLRKK